MQKYENKQVRSRILILANFHVRVIVLWAIHTRPSLIYHRELQVVLRLQQGNLLARSHTSKDGLDSLQHTAHHMIPFHTPPPFLEKLAAENIHL